MRIKKPKLIVENVKSNPQEWINFIDKILNWKPNKEEAEKLKEYEKLEKVARNQ